MKYTRTFKDIIKSEDPSQDTFPVGQAIVLGFLFLDLMWAYYFLAQ